MGSRSASAKWTGSSINTLIGWLSQVWLEMDSFTSFGWAPLFEEIIGPRF